MNGIEKITGRIAADAQAEAERESNEARVQADTQIAQKQTELEIKRAELKILADGKKVRVCKKCGAEI